VPVQLSFWAADVALCGNKVVVWHQGASVCVWDVVAGSLEKEYVEKQNNITLQGAYYYAAPDTVNRIMNTMTGEDVTSKYGDGRMTQVIFSRDDTGCSFKGRIGAGSCLMWTRVTSSHMTCCPLLLQLTEASHCQEWKEYIHSRSQHWQVGFWSI